MSCEIQPARHNRQPTNQEGTKCAGQAYMCQRRHILGQKWPFLGQKLRPVAPNCLMITSVLSRMSCPGPGPKLDPDLFFLQDWHGPRRKGGAGTGSSLKRTTWPTTHFFSTALQMSTSLRSLSSKKRKQTNSKALLI